MNKMNSSTVIICQYLMFYSMLISQLIVCCFFKVLIFKIIMSIIKEYLKLFHLCGKLLFILVNKYLLFRKAGMYWPCRALIMILVKVALTIYYNSKSQHPIYHHQHISIHKKFIYLFVLILYFCSILTMMQ